MSSLSAPLRRELELNIKQARKIAEGGARKALEALAVHESDPYRHLDEAQRNLRRKLRAQAKQLGDRESQTRRGTYEIKHLVEKLAYDQWHRLLFARFLLENNLLISPEHGVSVLLDDCEELAPSLGLKDAWAAAARFAAKELPEIFRADDPAGAVELPVEDRNPLTQLVTSLPVEVFTARDSLGWCYQFWQAERKDEINTAGNKIGADELPAVTQLFTEDYMVDFLLDNTLGAWHAGNVLDSKPTLAETAQSEVELRNAVALPGCHWEYLRFIKATDGKWTPAAGTFDGWPRTAKELKCLDPCMGSGHFVVAMFQRLVALRMAEEELDEAAAVAGVITENVFGLEIDPRCTQIAAFNLALAAWRRVGHCKLGAMNLACSGVAPNAKKEEWLKLAGENDRILGGMGRLYELFKDAPVLGSLINPRLSAEDMYVADYHELQPLLEKALAKETKDDSTYELGVTARGLAKAADVLASQFTLVATNVPYLGRGKQDVELKNYCESIHPLAKADLSTCFVERSIAFCAPSGTTVLVTPQNWLFLGTYKEMRRNMFRDTEWNLVAKLGPAAFHNMNFWAAKTALCALSRRAAKATTLIAGFDASETRDPAVKATLLIGSHSRVVRQLPQLNNPDARLLLSEMDNLPLLEIHGTAYQGIATADYSRFGRCFWEMPRRIPEWQFQQSTVDVTTCYSGREHMFHWEDGKGALAASDQARIQGLEAVDKTGIAVSQMNQLPVTLYTGEYFDNNCSALVVRERTLLPAVWAYCASDQFLADVREIDQAVKVTNASLTKVPFDLTHWQKVAAEKHPHGLPKPFSSDPTQWLFDGHPKGSDQPLHVAVARLLGYQWPRQTGSSFSNCPALGPDSLDKLADDDGIVCLSATKGEAPAAERLRGCLVQALGNFDISALIANAGPKGSKSETLEEWLRDEFYEQHCLLFHHRPFIWHLYDGHKNGFSVLVNYHQLTHANLEKLTYAYLGDWIRRQQAAVDAGESGSDARLQAAKQLQARLKLILEGDPPYDLFVRWKPLSKQPIGWHPDLNDGVRMNIRPFAAADILRKRVKINWEKDRGKEPVRTKKDFPWFWGWEEEKQDFAGVGKGPDGNRWNNCHYSNQFKQKAK